MKDLFCQTGLDPLANSSTSQYCSPGSVDACVSVLVIYSDMPDRALLEHLRDTGAFSKVDGWNGAPAALLGSSRSPTLSDMAAYDAVLVFNTPEFGYGFRSEVTLGDDLAAYFDQGGGVVIAYGANTGHDERTQWPTIPDSGNELRGKYGTAGNDYALLNYSGAGFSIIPSDSLGDVLEPLSPLMIGVASLNVTQAARSTASVIGGRGVVVARWRGGGQEPLVVRGARGGRNLVELNFSPASYGSITWAGDGAALLRNALKYSQQCRLCSPGTFAAAGASRNQGAL
jgi:hypothetical protein